MGEPYKWPTEKMIAAVKQLCERLEYRDGILYWKMDDRLKRLRGKVAGYKDPDRINICCGSAHVNVGAHQVVFYMHHGYLPAMIDHIDQDPHNNKIDNLRPTNYSDNMVNRRSWTVGPVGIRKRSDGTYQVRVSNQKAKLSFGHFPTSDVAAHEYNKAVIKVHGEVAVLNPVGVDPRG